MKPQYFNQLPSKGSGLAARILPGVAVVAMKLVGGGFTGGGGGGTGGAGGDDNGGGGEGGAGSLRTPRVELYNSRLASEDQEDQEGRRSS